MPVGRIGKAKVTAAHVARAAAGNLMTVRGAVVKVKLCNFSDLRFVSFTHLFARQLSRCAMSLVWV